MSGGALLGRTGKARSAAAQAAAIGDAPAKFPALTSRIFSSPRHTTHYWEAGPSDGPLMIFVHGWPEIGLMWRAQIKAFADQGWRCVAPDMRGYGGSSAPVAAEAYALEEIVAGHGRTSRPPRGAAGDLGRARSGKPGGRGAGCASPGTRPGRGPCVRSLFA